MTTANVVPAIAFAGASSPGTMGPFSLIKGGTPIYFTDDSQIKVLRYSTVDDTAPDVLVQDTDYTLTGGPSAGSITLTSPQTGLLTTERLFVYREGTYEQLLDLVAGGSFSAEALEARFDRITEFIEEVARKADTAIRLTPFSTDSLPDNVPMEAAIDKILYLTGTAAEPEYGFIENPSSLLTNVSALVPYVDAIEDVAADLTGADTIGTVAADLAGDDDIGTVSASIADIIAAAAAIDDLAAKQNASDLLSAIAGTSANFTAGHVLESDGTDSVRVVRRWFSTYADAQAYTGWQAGDIAIIAGRSTAGDGGGGMFRFVSGDQSASVTNDPGEGVWLAPDSDDTGASGAWKRIFTGAANLRWWAVTGDGSTDDATAVQYAFDFMEYCVQNEINCRSLFVPLGKYKLGSTITMTEGFKVFGEGCTMYRNRPYSTDVEEDGSWFYIAHTGKGFSCGGQGAASVRAGIHFEGIGTYRDQPTPASSWTPTAHDYDFYVDDCSEVNMRDVSLLNPTKGIGIDGVSGRVNLYNIRMDAFDLGIDIIRASGQIRGRDIHVWPFWYDDNIDAVDYIKDYKYANLQAVRTARADQPDFTGLFAIYAEAVWRARETADGQTGGVKISHMQADNCKYLVHIDSSNVTANVDATISNFKYSGFAGGSGTRGVYGNGLHYLQMSNGFFRRCDQSVIDSVAAGTVRLVNVHGEDWNNSGGGWPALRAVHANSLIEVQDRVADFTDGNSGALTGGASGRVIIPDVHGYNAAETSDGSGDITITHGLGATPTVVHVDIRNANNFNARVSAVTSTTFTFRLFDADAGTAKTSTAVNVMWTVKL